MRKIQAHICEILVGRLKGLTGREIAEQLTERGFWWARARVYLHLAALEERGILKHAVEPGGPERGGLPRHSYTIARDVLRPPRP